MKQEHEEFIDYSLKWLYDKDNEYGSDLQTASYNYQKIHGIDYDDDFCDKLTRVLEENSWIKPSSNNGMYRVTSKTIEIILQYGSYLNFRKSENEYNDRQKEIEDLNYKVSQLQADNFEYKTTLRDKDKKITSLDLKIKRLELIQKWWLVFGIFLVIVGYVIKQKEIFQFLIQLLKTKLH